MTDQDPDAISAVLGRTEEPLLQHPDVSDEHEHDHDKPDDSVS